MSKRKILLHCHQCPGDTVVSTMLVESMAKQYPELEIMPFGNSAVEVYANNPHVHLPTGSLSASEHQALNQYAKANDGRKTGENQTITIGDVTVVSCGTPRIEECNSVPIHMAEAMCGYVGEQIGLSIKLSCNRPKLYLTADEKAQRFRPEPYYLANAGWKETGETKWYSRWEETTRLLQAEWPELLGVQIGELSAPDAPKGYAHHHPRVSNTIDMLGRWNGQFRKLILAAQNAAFCMGPVTALMHVCVALGVPYVCVASGYEPMSWAWMPGVRYVSRQATLPCCRHDGCWKQTWAKCERLKEPTLPACLDIPAKEVFDAVAQLIDGGVATFNTMPKTAITLAMSYDQGCKVAGDANSKVLREYCEAQGYERLIDANATVPDGKTIHWHKIAMVRKWLAENQSGWFGWMDADTMIQNIEKRVEEWLDESADLIVGDDKPPNRFNAGVWFCQANERTREFFDRVWAHPGGEWREQTAMQEVAASMPDLRGKIVPRRTFNSFYGEHQPGDFLVHFANMPRVQAQPSKNGSAKASLYELVPCAFRDPAAVLADDGRPMRRDEPG